MDHVVPGCDHPRSLEAVCPATDDSSAVTRRATEHDLAPGSRGTMANVCKEKLQIGHGGKVPGRASAGIHDHDIQTARSTACAGSPRTHSITGALQPAECRAGRALLGWSLQELAARSGFPAPTISDFEEGRRALSLSARVALQRVFRKGLVQAGR
jgi:DNA-binding transcriptional regulator YiaG